MSALSLVFSMMGVVVVVGVLALLCACLLALTPAPASAATPNFCPPGVLAGQCNVPTGVAVDNSTGEPASGDVYVGDEQNERIDVFDSEGHFLRAFGWGVGAGAAELEVCTASCREGLRGPGAGEVSALSVAVDPTSHDVYAVDNRNDRIQKFTPSGEFLLMFGKEVDKTKVGAHAPEAQQDRCTKANLEEHNTCGAGTLGATLLGGRGSGPGVINTEFIGGTTQPEAKNGTALSVDGAGDVWLGDSERLERFGSGGEYLSELELPAFGDVTSLAAAPSGDFYAVSPPIDETQEIIAPPSGTYTLEFEGQATAPLPFNATVEEVAAALNGLLTVGENAKVSGASGAAYDVTFENVLALTNVPPIVISSGSVLTLANGTPGGLAKLGPSGEVLQTLDASGHPHALALDSATGDLFVSDQFEESQNPLGPGSLLEYDSSGTQTESFGAGGLTGSRVNALALGTAARRLYVTAGGTQEQSAVQAFALPEPGPLPEEDSEKAEPLGKTTATLTANVNPEGHPPTTVHFEYITEEQFKKDGNSFGAGTEKTAESESLGEDFSEHPVPPVAITGLQPETTYRFRLVATNEKGVVDGETATFTTEPLLRIDATYTTEVSSTAATLAVEINPLGDPATYRFEYLTQAQYEENGQSFSGPNAPRSSAEASTGTGIGDVIRTAPVQGLEPSTAYRYRVLASNVIRPAGIPGPVRSFTTQGSAASTLPDGRRYELVSPPNKHGAPLLPLGNGDIQAAAGGGKLTYLAQGPVSGEPAGTRNPEFAQLLSIRGAGGWTTQEITTPHEEITPAKAGSNGEYRLFSEDLSTGIVEPEGATPLSAQTTERTPYRREAGGEYVPLVTAANVRASTRFGGRENEPGDHAWTGGVQFVTATPDLSHVVLRSPQALTPGFGAGFVPSGQTLYELSGGQLQLVSVLPPNINGEEQPAAEVGLNSSVGLGKHDLRGALSNDGNRVVFETNNGPEGHLYERDLGLGRTLQLDVPEAGAKDGNGKAQFQGASSDGSRVFFTDTAQLTKDSTAVPGAQADLYVCEVKVSAEGRLSCALSDLSVDPNFGESANLPGSSLVSAIDASGEHVYFAANGVLTDRPNAHGEHAVAGNCEAPEGLCNLYVADVATRQVSLVAVLSNADRPDWAEELGGLTVRTSPNGRFLVFMSERSLTGYDNRDAASGALDEEVFLFDNGSGGASSLRCVSCNPSGARPHGVFEFDFNGEELFVDRPETWRNTGLAGSVPGWTRAEGILEETLDPQPRYVSDGGRVFFDSPDALVPQDTNGVEDVYQWEPPAGSEGVPASDTCTATAAGYSPASGGCVSLISSGTGSEESAFLDASVSGDDVFFLTGARLSPLDVDTALDVYDAHVCGAEAPCPAPPSAPPVCEGDACQNPASAPSDATPGSLTFNGPGNLTPTPAKKVTKKAAKCKRGLVKNKKNRCVKKKSKRRAKRAGNNRRAAR